jgi:hypothetical protein
MTMRFNTSLEKRTYLQMCCHDLLEWTREKKTIDKSQYYPLTDSSMPLQSKKSPPKIKRRHSCY